MRKSGALSKCALMLAGACLPVAWLGLPAGDARAVEGHFAIRVLRGEEYFVVVQNLTAESAERLDPSPLVRRIALTADGLEDRLTRGLDLY